MVLTDSNFASDEVTISKERYMEDVNAIISTRDKEGSDAYERGRLKGREELQAELDKKKDIQKRDEMEKQIKQKRKTQQLAKEERTTTPLVKADKQEKDVSLRLTDSSPAYNSQEARTLSSTEETTQFDSAQVNEGSNPSPDTRKGSDDNDCLCCKGTCDCEYGCHHIHNNIEVKK